MAANDELLAGLRDALRVSPDNLPLRKAFADMLMGYGYYAEAEAEYRALALSVGGFDP